LTGDELARDAMKRDLNRLSKRAHKAKTECDSYLNAGTELSAIHDELLKVLRSGETGQEVIDRLEGLKRRERNVNRIMKKDLLKLINKQSDAEIARDRLIHEISMRELRISLRAARG